MRRLLARFLALTGRGTNVLMFARAAPFYARYTVRFHIPAEILIGLFGGVMMMADLVTRKTLGAPKWMLALQSSVPMMTFTLAMVWRDLLEGESRRKILLLTGLFGKGILVLVAFVASPGPFLGIVIIFALVDSAFIPLRNAIFRANYSDSIRGRLFGGVVSLANLALVFSNLVAAFFLDHWEWTYRILFPVAGVIGFGAHAIYARVKVRGGESERPRAHGVNPITRAFRTTVRILKEDKLFRAYELGFFIYGLAFLMNLPLVILLIVDRLGLPYKDASWARFVIPQVLMIVLAPFAGRLLDKSHPARMMTIACALLSVHAILLFFTESATMLGISYAVFGVAMTPVILAWNLGPVQFAPTERESGDYMAVHVTLTGLRAILGPVLALSAERLLGLSWGFIVSAGFYLAAALLMARLARRVRREKGSDPVSGQRFRTKPTASSENGV